MNGMIQLGPVAMATERLLAVVAIWAFLAMAGVIATRMNGQASKAGWVALLMGLIAGRIGFVAINLEAFRIEPWTVLAVWQGGFSGWLGAIAAIITIFIMLGRKPAGVALAATVVCLMLAHIGASMLLAPQVRPMPRLAVEDIAGNRVEFGGAGRPMVINLWATWCPPCLREMPMLIDVARTAQVPVLLVNQGEDAADVRAFLTRQGFADEAILLDGNAALGRAVGSSALPTTLFVNAAGDVVELHAGEISRAALTAEIRDLQRSK